MPHNNKSFRLLRMILFLSGSYPKTKEECMDFLEINKSAFYEYRNELQTIGFNMLQKEGRFWIETKSEASNLLSNMLHFTEEEAYVLSKSIDAIEGHSISVQKLKQKLVAFLNREKVIDAYLKKEKSAIALSLNQAKKGRRQVLLVDYSSGNSQTVRNRRVEPFEFKEDFNLLWAFDTELKKNRQFKICRIGDIVTTPFDWEFERLHRSMPVDVFRNTGELNKQVEFTMNLRARNLLTEEYPLAGKNIAEKPNNKFLFKAPVAKYEGPARFVLGIAEDISLIGDGGFLKFVKEKIKISQELF
ncbi:WYL domain-containing protein [uncultured Draconibacterium sp.]|uniref:helix-turn-helix transcriptional regulator n=1 Tax=uncultured Draconibacterium sp. TaxID=1573823 RepID=UPI0029C8266F|nr:WYL domain-containing protein [uncultured Draconibacterium sp.]